MRLDQAHELEPMGAFAAGLITGWFAHPDHRLQLTGVLCWRRAWTGPIQLEMSIEMVREMLAESDLPARMAEVGASLETVEWPMVMMGLDALDRLRNDRHALNNRG